MLSINHFKPLLAALLLAGAGAAQAAHFEVTDYLAAGGYSGMYASEAFSHDATDLSQDGNVSVAGAAQFADDAHGYAADGYFTAGSNLWLTISQSAALSSGITYAGDTLVAMPMISLRLVSDGEAAGSPVQVSFLGQGWADTSFAGTSGGLSMDMSVSSNGVVLGSFLWDAGTASNAAKDINFSFQANVGDEIVLSAFMAGNLMADGSQAAGVSALAGSLSGDFAVAAVPEPETYALLLAGLGVIGVVARRRKD